MADDQAGDEQVPAWVAERLGVLEALVVELRAENERLRARVAELERRLHADSRTSSKPPSSDGPRKPPRPAQARQVGARRPGKQPGAPGAALAQVAAPDERRVHVPRVCSGCGGELLGAPVVRRQVHDLPEIRVKVTEHQAQQRACACGQITTGVFPAGVGAPAVYGPRVRALGCYLLVGQHLPVARAAELMGEVLGVPVATGTLAELTGQAAGGLDGFGARIRELLAASAVVHADEMSARVAGVGQWVHSVSTDRFTWQGVHPKRGIEGIDALGVLGGYHGVVVHDDWAPYRRYAGATHALCGAHLLRDLAAVAETPGQGWAVGMRRLLLEAAEHTQAARAAGQNELDTDVIAGIHAGYQQLCDLGVYANPAAGMPEGKRRRVKRPPPVNLLARLIAHRDEILRFVTDLRVPFSNNQAERDIRMVKLQQKISGCWRTVAGASAFLAVRSYLSTARKHGLSALAILCQLFNGAPWLPQVAST